MRNSKITTLFLLLLLSAGCRKEEKLVAENPSATGSGSANLMGQFRRGNPLSCISIERGAIHVDSFSHLGDALDSLGHMSQQTQAAWEQTMGFTSLRTKFNQTMDEYAEMADGVSPSGVQLTMSDITSFWANSANEAIIDGEESYINASCEKFASLLNLDHVLFVENSVIYNDESVYIQIPASELPNLAAYQANPNDIMTPTVTVIHQAKTTAKCGLGLGQHYLGEISCGSPGQKRSRIYYNMNLYYWFGGNGYIFYVDRNFPFVNQKRGFLGFWYAEARGTHVAVNVSSSYFSGPFTSLLVNGNAQSNPIHYMPLYQFVSLYQTPAQFAASLSVCLSGNMYVAPMCSGNIMSLTL